MSEMLENQLPEWYYIQTDTSKASPMGAKEIPNPPGYTTHQEKKKNAAGSTSTKKDAMDVDNLKVKKAWEVALAPAKSLPMNLFMSYMSGNSLQIVPIMMTSMMFFLNPVKQIWGASKQFEPLVTKTNANDIFLTKLAFIACQLLAVVAGVWKLGQMGLLPNTQSDWLAWESETYVTEQSL